LLAIMLSFVRLLMLEAEEFLVYKLIIDLFFIYFFRFLPSFLFNCVFLFPFIVSP
jgi:hypothetical protein